VHKAIAGKTQAKLSDPRGKRCSDGIELTDHQCKPLTDGALTAKVMGRLWCIAWVNPCSIRRPSFQAA
jgi:hypothetical protein